METEILRLPLNRHNKIDTFALLQGHSVHVAARRNARGQLSLQQRSPPAGVGLAVHAPQIPIRSLKLGR